MEAVCMNCMEKFVPKKEFEPNEAVICPECMKPFLPNGERIRSVCYARVSTDDHNQLNETQVRDILRYCGSHDYEISKFFTDKKSGTTLDRPGFKRVLSECIIGESEVNVLVCYDQSRLTRDQKLDFVREKIRPCKLVFVVNGDLDSDSAAGQAVNGVKQFTDKLENDTRKSKTKSGMNSHRLQGKHMGHPAKFMFYEDADRIAKGDYDKGQGGTAMLGRFKDDYTITYSLSDAFELFAQGKTYTYLARTLSLESYHIHRELKRKKLLQKYHEVVNAYYSNRRLQKVADKKSDFDLQKGLIAEGCENTEFSDCERVSEEDLQKATVLQEPIANKEGEE